MRIIDPGHVYQLDKLDREPGRDDHLASLTFVRRVGDKYPGNEGEPRAGVTTQEVLRALVARTIYVDRQVPCGKNLEVLRHLREAIRALEVRAADRRGDVYAALRLEMGSYDGSIEDLATCATCGHVLCADHQNKITT